MRVSVYRTVKLFLDTGEVSDRKRSCRPRVVRTPQAIKAVESTKIQSEKKKKIMGNGYCTENHELHYQTRLGAFKQDNALPLH